jgi:hypothetical protein
MNILHLKQQGVSGLAEVATVVAITTTVISGGLSFFQHSIAQAQAAAAFDAAKIVAHDVHTRVATGQLCAQGTETNNAREGVFAFTPPQSQNYIQSANWMCTNNRGEQARGTIQVLFKNQGVSNHVAGKVVLFDFQGSTNGIAYIGCRTNIIVDSSPEDTSEFETGQIKSNIIDCIYQSRLQ